jgi:hypothetical protein
MECPRCHEPATEDLLQEFGGVCPKCVLAFAGEKDAPSFPNLEIVELVGQGGMGVVYKAIQKNLNRTVALKVLSPKLSDDPEFLGRFSREAQALAQLSHPNIVAIHDTGVHDRVPYLVMEFVEGRSLRALLQSRGITVAQVLDLIPQICDALQYAHSRGVIHRDIKPENILVDAAGRVKIADYGLAKLAKAEDSRLTKSGYVMGTPHYMSPEQVENSSQVDHRADIYSLGVIFYEMLTGELPLGHFKPPSQKGAGDRRLDPVVLKSLEKEPADRYQSASEVREQVARIRKSPAPPRLRAGYVPPEPPSALKKAAFVLANLGGLGLGAGLIMGLARMPLAEAIGGLGMCLLLAAFVVGIVAVIRHGFRKARAGHVGWIATLAALAVGFAYLTLSNRSDGHPEESGGRTSGITVHIVKPKIKAITKLWEDDLPADSDVLGLLGGATRLLVASKTDLREFEPRSGKFTSLWRGTIEALPILDESLVVLWGAGKLTVLQDRGKGSLQQIHQRDLPCPGVITGTTTMGTLLYASTNRNACFAYDFLLDEVVWTRTDLGLLPIGAPVATELDVVLFDRSSQRITLNRLTGELKSRGTAEGGSEKMVQWKTGWAMMHPNGIHVEFNTYFKQSLEIWSGVRALNTPDFSRCSMTVADETLIVTTETEIFGQHTDKPFGESWHSSLPRTTGPLAPIGNGLVAVPTTGGMQFYQSERGFLEHDTVPAWTDRTLVAGSHEIVRNGSWFAVLHPKTGKLIGYSIDLKEE